MLEMHLRKPGSTYKACGPSTKNKERIQKFKETRGSRYIYQNELDKACFLHDMAYGDSKDLSRRTAPDKLLRDKAFNIAKNPKYDGWISAWNYINGVSSFCKKYAIHKETGINFEKNQLAEEFTQTIS